MHDFHLETERLIIRNWNEEDRDLFHFINSDDRVMEFFSIRRSREQSDKMMDDLRKMISDQGYGYTAIALKETNEAIGFCGLSPADKSGKTFADALASCSAILGQRICDRSRQKAFAIRV